MEIKARFIATGRVGYNKNYGVGGWVTFPITSEELVKKFAKWGEEMPEYTRYMFKIAEWEAPSFVEDELDLPNKAFDLEAVNEVAKHLEDIDEEDVPIVEALLEYDYDLEDACRIVAKEEYEDLRDEDPEDIVKEYTEDNYDVPDYILDHIDYSDCVDDFFDEVEGYVNVQSGKKTGYIKVND